MTQPLPNLIAPIATVTIEPRGDRHKVPRDYFIRMTLKGTDVMGLARDAFAGFAPATQQADRRRFEDVLAKPRHPPSRSSDAPPPPLALIGAEATVSLAGRPDEESIALLRTILVERGHRAHVRETRECAEAECSLTAQVDWSRPQEIPRGWYSRSVCGKHDYKECPSCKSLYSMTIVSITSQAPSLSCEVCGGVLVEWGGTKVWSAERKERE